MAERRISYGSVQSAGVGGVGDAAAYGYIFSAVYTFGGCGISAESGLQSRQAVPKMLRVRKAGVDYVHGLRMQCVRSYRMQDN